MGKPVLLLVMSDTCGACQKFKVTALPSIEKEIKKQGNVELLKLEFPIMQISTDDVDSKFEYHPELNKFVTWFPTFILVPDNLWFDKGSKLSCLVKDKEGVDKSMEDRRKGIVPQPGDKRYPDYSKDSILDWIKTSLSSDSIFTKRPELKGPLVKNTSDGKVSVPTHGTYSTFINDEIPEEF